MDNQKVGHVISKTNIRIHLNNTTITDRGVSFKKNLRRGFRQLSFMMARKQPVGLDEKNYFPRRVNVLFGLDVC